MNAKVDTLVIAAGGNIDSPDPADIPKGRTVLYSSRIKRDIRNLGVEDFEFRSLGRSLSGREFTPSVIRNLADIVTHSEASHVIITADIDRLPENTLALAERLEELREGHPSRQAVFLTGAAGNVERDKEALANLATALAQKDAAPSGVYFIRHGKIYGAGERLEKAHGIRGLFADDRPLDTSRLDALRARENEFAPAIAHRGR